MVEHHMFSEATRFTELRRRLLEADPDLEPAVLAELLDGASNLPEAIGCVLRSALDDEAMAEALKRRVDDMRARLERVEATCARKRGVALAAMEDAGIEKILEPDFTASLRVAPPSVVVTDEEQIPEWFWIPQDPKLDRKGILDAMKAGTAVAGAELSNSRVTLAVRTR